MEAAKELLQKLTAAREESQVEAEHLRQQVKNAEALLEREESFAAAMAASLLKPLPRMSMAPPTSTLFPFPTTPRPLPLITTPADLRMATRSFSETISKGNFGTIYRADALPPIDVPLAIKQLRSDDPYSVDNFTLEYMIALKCSHPNVLPLLFYNHEALCFAYPLALGGTLHERLLDPTPVLEWQTRCRILCETLRALIYLHGHDGPHVLHLDVKPSNIHLDEHCQAMLAATGTFQRGPPPSEQQAYLDPLMRESGPHTMNDGYAFGVVALASLVGCIDGLSLSMLCFRLREHPNTACRLLVPDVKAGKCPAALSARLPWVISQLVAKEVCMRRKTSITQRMARAPARPCFAAHDGCVC